MEAQARRTASARTFMLPRLEVLWMKTDPRAHSRSGVSGLCIERLIFPVHALLQMVIERKPPSTRSMEPVTNEAALREAR